MTNSNGHHKACPLPVGWAACSLADAVAPGRPRGNPADFVGQPFIGLEHIEAHTTRMLGFVPAETMRSSCVQFSAGDVLYGRMRPYLNKVWLADRDGLCSGEFIVFPRTGALRGAFLKYRLNAQDFVTFTDHATTGDRPRADFADFGKFPVLVPPLAEQTRIADRIDELFTDLAAGVAALERVKRNLTRYRAAVLHAAVTGRLTEAWRTQYGPPDEPGPKLLERILAERRRRWEELTRAKYEKAGKQPPKNWRERYPEPSPPKLPSDGSRLPKLPEGWCWASVDQLIWDGSYGTSVRCDYGASAEPVLRIPNIAKGELDLEDIKNATSSLGIADDAEFLAPGDLLICRTNGSIRLIGKAALVRSAFAQPTYFASYLIRLRAIDMALGTHLHLTFTSAHGRAFIEANAASSAGQHNVSMTTLQQMPVAVPPAREQAAIVETVNEKLSQIDGLEAEIERGLARASRLRQSILKAAFEGKLVPQDPSDEPARVLLERIRAAAVLAEAPRGGSRTRGSQAMTNGVSS
ncbi:MAG: hypothetical protein KF838_04360 [Phycisphaeraceae bacterium]|nr:MAG: hypothetical protein KF838_04360 [Phycisphaeraceae bacterium]